jgi:hypothetical protein
VKINRNFDSFGGALAGVLCRQGTAITLLKTVEKNVNRQSAQTSGSNDPVICAIFS